MTLAELRTKLLDQYPDLTLFVHENGDYVTLHDIIVKDQSEGTGTAVMQALCEWCDENNKIFGLTPSTDFGASSKKRLTEFYQRFGFESNLGSKRDFRLNETMRRDPIARPSLDPVENTDTSQTLEQQITALAPDLIQAAQNVLDDWQVDEDGVDVEFGHGGACDAITDVMSEIIQEHLDVEIHPGGFEGDDHAYLVVVDENQTVTVDIPAHVYETGGGYNWQKREGVILKEQDLIISSISAHDLDL